VIGAAVIRRTQVGCGEVGAPHGGGCDEQEEEEEREETVPWGELPMAPVVGRWAEACFPVEAKTTEAEVRKVLEEAAEAAREDHDAASAVAWADGYTFPPEYMDSDIRCLRAAQLDFPAMIRRRLKILSPKRLSAERVARLRPDNPERALMNDLVGGMRVHLPTGFKPNRDMERTPRRRSYETVASAVNKMLGAVWEQQLAFFLPLQLALENVPNLHLCKAHWTTKKGKPSGRPLGDLSNVDGTPINTDETKAAAAAYYGRINHPTIENIAVMIYDFFLEAKARDPTCRWGDMRIWKMDLKGAYTLLSYRPEDVGLFAMLLTGDVVYFQIAGIFGWSGTPAAFHVVTRAISWELRHALAGRALMYVDDILGVCFAKDLESDLALTKGICTDLMGPGSIADDKTEHGVRLDMIGYTIDLETHRVLISLKNFLAALHGFVSIDVTKRIKLPVAQRLASWGTRYGKICRVMRPFCGALNRVTIGRTEPHALFHWSGEAVIAIQCWRAMLCLVRYRETEFTRTIESFAQTTPVSIIEFDSSLSGAGLIWADRSTGAEVVVGVGAVDLTLLGFGVDSSFQNLSEYVGAILAVVGQVVLGMTGSSIALRGDSVTALTWAITERPRGSIVTNAAMVWTLLCIAADINVREITHIPGEDNQRCDRLSRRGSNPALSIVDEAAEMGITGARVIELNGDQTIMGIIELCDPRILLESESEFVEFWTKARRVIDIFITTHVPRPSSTQEEVNLTSPLFKSLYTLPN
jgi:hypothetical protein